MFAFERKSALGEGKITVSSEYLRGKAPFKGTFKITGTVPSTMAKPLTLNLTLVDHPNGRVWEKKSFKMFPNSAVNFEFKNYRMPNEAGILYATVTDARGNTVLKADKVLYFPSDKLPLYYQATFGQANSINMAKQLVDNMGFGTALAHLTRASSRNLAMLNAQLIPYLVRVNMGTMTSLH